MNRKAIEDKGHAVHFPAPPRPPVYEEHKLPDPVQCAGCIITINNRADGSSLRLAQSDGSRWRRLKYADEGDVAVTVQPPQDITHHIRAAVREALPAMLPPPETMRVIPAPQPSGDAVKTLAAGQLELSEHVIKLMNDYADLAARLEFVEQHGIGRANLEAA